VRDYCVNGSSVCIQVLGCRRKTFCLRKAWMLLVFV